MTITIKTHAKLNLSLRVYAPREDGYHPLQSIFQTISLHDILTIETTPEKGCSITCTAPEIPTDHRNILHKTYTLLENKLPIGLKITLTKHIPNGAGMGGGSTNAAGLLRVLNNEYLNLSEKDLINIAVTIGADVPFFLLGGTAYVEGIGEIMTPVYNSTPHTHYLLVKPPIHCSTKDIFTRFDATQPTKAPTSPCQDILDQHLNTNDLKDTVFQLDPRFKETEDILSNLLNSPIYMSGSGSTLFTSITPETYAKHLPELKEKLPNTFIHICTPVHGPAITIAS